MCGHQWRTVNWLSKYAASSVCHCLAVPNAPFSMLAEIVVYSSCWLINLDSKVVAFHLWAAQTAAVESQGFGAAKWMSGIYSRDRGRYSNKLNGYFCHVDRNADQCTSIKCCVKTVCEELFALALHVVSTDVCISSHPEVVYHEEGHHTTSAVSCTCRLQNKQQAGLTCAEVVN